MAASLAGWLAGRLAGMVSWMAGSLVEVWLASWLAGWLFIIVTSFLSFYMRLPFSLRISFLEFKALLLKYGVIAFQNFLLSDKSFILNSANNVLWLFGVG